MLFPDSFCLFCFCFNIHPSAESWKQKYEFLNFDNFVPHLKLLFLFLKIIEFDEHDYTFETQEDVYFLNPQWVLLFFLHFCLYLVYWEYYQHENRSYFVSLIFFYSLLLPEQIQHEMQQHTTLYSAFKFTNVNISNLTLFYYFNVSFRNKIFPSSFSVFCHLQNSCVSNCY